MSIEISKARKKRTKASSSKKRKKSAPAIPALNIILAIIIGLVALGVLYTGRAIQHTDLVPGQLAPTSQTATLDFECMDLAATELQRNNAADNVRPVYSIDYKSLLTAERTLNKVFDQLVSQASSSNSVQDALEIMDVDTPAEQLEQLAAAAEVETIRETLRDHLEQAWNIGIITRNGESSGLVKLPPSRQILLRNKQFSDGKNSDYDSLLSAELALARTVRDIMESLPALRPHHKALTTLLRPYIQPNLIFEPALTEEARTKAREAVEPSIMKVRTGDSIIEMNLPVDEQSLAILQAHREALIQEQTQAETVQELLSNAALIFTGLFVFLSILYLLEPKLIQKPSPILIAGALSILVMLAAKGLIYAASNGQLISPSAVTLLIPIAIAPLTASILLGSSFGLAVGVWTTFVVAITMENSFNIFIQGMVVTMTAILCSRAIHKRSNVFRAGLWIGAAQAILAILVCVLTDCHYGFTFTQAGTAFVSGMVLAAAALVLIPAFELTFRITTDISLLELSDMSHPLLERMALEAPGTYHHSLMVANLAQSAAAEIGANDLLVRVCAYYHDIGKLSKPEFFIENINQTNNPHDDLSPSMSTLVITSHVKEGVSMASRYKLPEPIVEAIKQHHGTSLISYFLHRAKTIAQEEGSEPPKEEDFRYPGPRPSSAEMGILMMADSIEAASRSIEKPSPSNIENMVNDIVNEKLQDRQLNHCDLTFEQLASIKKSFIFNLNNMLHGRIPYPKDENRNNKSSTLHDTANPDPAETQFVDFGTSSTS